jgi:hypothetical protein
MTYIIWDWDVMLTSVWGIEIYFYFVMGLVPAFHCGSFIFRSYLLRKFSSEILQLYFCSVYIKHSALLILQLSCYKGYYHVVVLSVIEDAWAHDKLIPALIPINRSHFSCDWNLTLKSLEHIIVNYYFDMDSASHSILAFMQLVIRYFEVISFEK